MSHHGHSHSAGGHSHGGGGAATASACETAAPLPGAPPPAPREVPRRAYCAEEDDEFLVRRPEAASLPTEAEQLQAAYAALAAPPPTFAAAAAHAAAAAIAPDTLPAHWTRAEALFHHIQDNGDASGCPVAHHCPAEHLTDALGAFRACAVLIRSEGLFSPNEVVEDVPTPHLRYLLAEYYIAALLLRGLPGPGRAAALQQARVGFEAYVRTCIAMGIVSRGEDWGALLVGEGEDEERGSGGGGAGGGGRAGGGAPPTAPTAPRAAKIERFKRAQAAKKRLAELAAAHAAQLARAQRSGGAEGGEDGVGGSATTAGGGMDDDLLREHALLTLAASARGAVEDVQSIDAELPLLAHKAKMEASAALASGGRGGAQVRAPEGGAWDPRAPPRAAPPPPGDLSTDPARPGIKVTRINPQWEIQEETVKAGIFQSGHLCVSLSLSLLLRLRTPSPHTHTLFLPHCSAPTMSMAEWGDHVMDLTMQRDARDKKQAALRVQSIEELTEQGKEDNEVLMDAATMKKRAFEDWADGVPRGSGNTKRI